MDRSNFQSEKLSSIVRSVSLNNEAREQSQRSAQNTPVPWDGQQNQGRPKSRESTHHNTQRDSRDLQPQQRDRDVREAQRERVERYGNSPRQPHARNGSGNTGNTGVASAGDYAEPHNTNGGRRHDYDVQSMETSISSPRASITKNPIPAPTVTVRSEYPTLSRSRQQQSLTCLVTIEVPEGKWSPDPADLRGAPVLPSMQQNNTYARPRSPPAERQADWPFESSEVLEEITEDLRVRVDNWHGLDFQRHVQCHLTRISPNSNVWQIRQAASLRDGTSWQRSPVVAGIGVLPLCGNAYMRKGKERRRSTVCRRQF